MYLRNVILVAIVLAMASFAQPTVGTGPALVTGLASVPATLDGPYLVRYAANLASGESYIDIVNDGAMGASLLGPGEGPQTGNICANIYAIDPNEELVSCCSCLITPDQTVHLGAVANLINNTETGKTPPSITIKLLASITGAGAASTSPTSCANSASLVGTTAPGLTPLLVAPYGMLAWSTTLHFLPGSTNTYATTEAPFLPATLSVTEVESLADRCANIIGNASGSGICLQCSNGALGAKKM
jgi:hypothetical protein